MLSRTAQNLFWLSRYIERAENMGRLLDVTYRMSLLPSVADQQASQWRPLLMIGHSDADFVARYGQSSAESVIGYLGFDPDNPSSIFSCIAAARENARAERSAISTEMWESLNATYLEIASGRFRDAAKADVRRFFDWVKERSHLFRGVTFGTMYRDDAFHFLRLGTFLERADNTARILDIKYHQLLPENYAPGDPVDYFQWGALLRSVSAFRAYRQAYHDTIDPQKIAELLILDADLPRSLHYCCEEAVNTLATLCGTRKRECLRLAGELHASLKFGRIDRIVAGGLHAFLNEFVRRSNGMAAEIQRDFMMSLQVD
ncbi:MAG: alpha-E domain-containing protein [Rhodospirillaceae bacterium]|nr:alpha-E domain-containing protein [Rhodospirillaceae bacterium]